MDNNNLLDKYSRSCTPIGRPEEAILTEIFRMFPQPTWESSKPRNIGDQCRVIQLRRGSSLITIMYRPSAEDARVEWSSHNTTYGQVINTLADSKYKVVAYLALQLRVDSSFQLAADLHRPGVKQFNTSGDKTPRIIMFQCDYRNISAFKDGVKIYFNYSGVTNSSYPTPEFSVESKDTKTAKQYHTVALPTPDLKTTLAVAESEHRRLHATDKSHLPEPHTFEEANFSKYSGTGDFGPFVGLERKNGLVKAAVLGIAALHVDGSVTMQAHNPNNDDVWFIVACQAYTYHQFTLAVREDQWYVLSGKKYLRISAVKDTNLRLTSLDQDLIFEVVRQWMA